nr:hypothetical protein [Tanacetum cinerariifolium]
SFGLCDATEDLTSFIKAKQQEGLQFCGNSEFIPDIWNKYDCTCE